MLLLFFEDEHILISTLQNKIFITFSRVSFNFFNVVELLIYLLLSLKLYHFEISWTYGNIFIITISFMMLLFIISVVVALLFELPVRILTKKILRNKKNKLLN
jgi:hypothetical protein